jgi:prepilin-type processing-associated H-X9-DG protein
VAILPYTEYDKLYREFHLDEPWDSPHNKALIEKMPAVFRSPKSKSAKGYTNYVVPVGGGALYSTQNDEPTNRHITDGMSDTIMLVEVGDEHAVPWTKPDDLSFDPQEPSKGIGRLYERGFNAAFCDGSVHFNNKSVDDKTLKAIFTRAGGEPIDWSKF